MGSPRWWVEPVERNAFARLAVVPGELHRVFAVRGTSHVWAVGEGGLVAHSADGGRTWMSDSLRAHPSVRRPSAAPKAAALLTPTESTMVRLALFTEGGLQGQQVEVVTVPRVIGLLQGSAEKTLLAAELKPGKVTRNGGGTLRVVQQSPAAGARIAKGTAVDLVLGAGGGAPDKAGAQRSPVQGAPYQQNSPEQRTPTDTAGGSDTPDRGDSLQRASAQDTAAFYPNLRDVCFATADVGWIVGDAGALFGTSDGGRTWHQYAQETAERLTAVACLDRTHAVALGGATLVLRTGDGRAWTAGATHLDMYPTAAVAVDSQTVIAVRKEPPNWPNLVIGSSDAGTSWRSIQVGDSAPARILGVAFDRSGKGVATSSLGFWVTADRGLSWAKAGCWQAPGAGPHPSGQTVLALSSTAGVAIDSGGRVWRTEDGWRTCRPSAGPGVEVSSLTSGPNGVLATVSEQGLLTGDLAKDRWRTLLGRRRLTAVYFADSLRGWVASLDGLIAKTSDGGSSWSTARLPANALIEHLVFATDRHGFAAAEDSVFQTIDGGRSWHTVAPTASGSVIRPIAFADSAVGWGVDHYDTLYVSQNGGSSWSAADGYVGSLVSSLGRSGLSGLSLRFDTPTRDTIGWSLRDNRLQSIQGGSVTGDSIPTSLTAVSRVTPTLGFAIDSAGGLLRTDNGGRNWTEIKFESRKYPAPWYYPILLLSIMVTVVTARRPPRPVDPSKRSVADLLVSDRPLREGDRDVLDFRSISDGLSRFLRNPRTQPPLTIAVTGPWGTGKSSLMLMLQRDLERYRFRTVWFNAWHHQREESLLASLLETIRYRAVPPWWSPRGLRFRLKLLGRRYRRYMTPLTFFLPVLALAVGWIFADAPQRLADLKSLFWSLASIFGDKTKTVTETGGEAPASTVLAVVVSIAGGLWTYLKGLKAFGVKPALVAQSLAGASKLRTVELKAGFRYLFAQDFKEVTDALKPERLVVFIDDLDRCKPEQILEILEAVNFLVDSGDCVVVMGMDRKRVIGSVGIGFKEVASILVESPGADGDGAAPPAPAKPPELRIARDTPAATAAKPAAAATTAGPAAAGTAADQSTKRIQTDYATQYLEKLINMEIAIPDANAKDLGDVMTASMPTEQTAKPAEPVPLAARLKPYRVPLQGLAVAVTVVACFFAGLRGWWPWSHAAAPAATVVALPSAPADSGSPGGQRVETVTAPEGTVEPVRHTPISLIPGAPTRRTWWPLALGLALTLTLMAWLLIPVEPSQVHDSPAFSQALKSWSPVLYSSLRTPRSAKKFLNRVRYLAMLQRSAPPPSAPIDRLLAWVGERSQRLRRIIADLLAHRTDSRNAPPPKIPENVLVALSVIRETRPAWLADDEFWTTRLSQYVVKANGTVPEALRSAIEKVQDVPRFDTYKNEWTKISGGVRTD